MQCGSVFTNLPEGAYVSVPAGDIFAQHNPDVKLAIDPDNETGRKTFMWYRIYCGAMTLLYLFVAGVGIAIAFFMPQSGQRDEMEMYITGIVYAIVGVPFAILYLVAALLPPRPWNWIVGFVAIGIGLTSCCFLPALIPLLIFWIKPETQAFLGRKQ
jgi:MFS family permease